MILYTAMVTTTHKLPGELQLPSPLGLRSHKIPSQMAQSNFQQFSGCSKKIKTGPNADIQHGVQNGHQNIITTTMVHQKS